jgi:molecular chaperone HtpG
MPRIQTNFQGLVRLLAKNLYPEPDVFIRELVQNGHDAIQFRRLEDRHLSGRIDILTDAKARTIQFLDNGMGMNAEEVEKFLSTIGTSGTGERTQEYLSRGDKAQVLSTIGQFGIGLLSAFVVAEQIEVVTRRFGGDTVLRWVCHGGEDYDLTELELKSVEPGTRVTLNLASDQAATLDEDAIRKTVKKYADLLPFGIYLNGNGPINSIDAPWHREGWASPEEYERALSEFLNRRFPDYPLLVIPIEFESPAAKGALYISDRHVPGINTPGLLDIFQNRMCIRLNDQDLLPEWAKFVRGVIDSPALTPTAARDNVQRDFAYHELRRQLGKLIVAKLIALSQDNPRKFERICAWHHYHLKGMAVHHEDFFDALVEYLPFETNQGLLSLRTYIARQAAEPGRKIPVYYFSYGLDSNQFYDLCNAKGIIAINTGRPFEETLVRRYVQKHSRTLELRQLDTLHDESLFRPLSDAEHQSFRPLEDALRRALGDMRLGNVTPLVRRFEPSSMSGALIGAEKAESIETLETILSQPNVSEGLGELAEDALRKLRDTPLTLYLNANNEIVQRLAALRDLDSRRHQLFLLGLYNCALIYSQNRMTPDNTRIFYDQFQEHMRNSLALSDKVAQLEDERERWRLEILERDDAIGQREASVERGWLRCFVMMPFDDSFRSVERALRAVLQGAPYFFEVVLARDRLREQELRRNVQQHLRDADLFIADISEHSPNVFLELGWPFFAPEFDRHPKILLRAKSGKPRPVDLASLINHEYDSPEAPDLEGRLREAFTTMDSLQALLARRPGRFLSADLVSDLPFLAEDGPRRLLCSQFRSVESLLAATREDFARQVPKEYAWLANVLDHIQTHVRERVG